MFGLVLLGMGCAGPGSPSELYAALGGKVDPAQVVRCEPLPDRTTDALISGELLPPESPLDPQGSLEGLRSFAQQALATTAGRRLHLVERSDGVAGLLSPEAGTREARERELPPALAEGLRRLAAFHRRNRAVPRDRLAPDALERLLGGEPSRAAVRAMVALDARGASTEVGGLALITDGPPARLELIPVPGEGAALAQALADAEPEVALALLRDRTEPLPLLEDRRQILLREIPKLTDPTARAGRIDLFRENYTFMARHTYLLSLAGVHQRIMEGIPDGLYLGLFHVHPPANRPSMEDKLAAAVQRNLVLVPQEDRIEVHYLFFGKLEAEPRVMRVPLSRIDTP